MSWRHLGIFQGKCLRDMFRCLGYFFLTGEMPERRFEICGRHLVFFPARCLRGMLRCRRDTWKYLRDSLAFFQARCLRAMFRCLGNMLRWLRDILAFFQAKCLRDMLKCLGDMLRCMRDILFFLKVQYIGQLSQRVSQKIKFSFFVSPNLKNLSNTISHTVHINMSLQKPLPLEMPWDYTPKT